MTGYQKVDLSIQIPEPIPAAEKNDEAASVSWWNFIEPIFCILAYLYDYGTDISLIIEYFNSGNYRYCAFTVVLIVLSGVASTWFNQRMHFIDSQQVEQTNNTDKRSRFEKIVYLKPNCIVVALFQLSRPLRNLRSLCWAWKVRQCTQEGDYDGQHHYFSKMRVEAVDLALLNIVETFLEAAPQLILQLATCLIQNQVISDRIQLKISIGVFFLAWSMMQYHHLIRLAQQNNDVIISSVGRFFLFVSYVYLFNARIRLIGLAASEWPMYILLVCIINIVGWAVWIYRTGECTEFCRGKDKDCREQNPRIRTERFNTFGFAAIVGVVYLFSFVNLKKGPTFKRRCVYYILYTCLNVTIAAVWYVLGNSNINDDDVVLSLFQSKICKNLLGIFYMCVYYFCCHPTVWNRIYNWYGNIGIQVKLHPKEERSYPAHE